MKKKDFYFAVSLILFVLCIGLSNFNVSSLIGYYHTITMEPNLLLQISFIAFLYIIYFIVSYIFSFFKMLSKEYKK